jgi:hypothetical protein
MAVSRRDFPASLLDVSVVIATELWLMNQELLELR